MQCKLEISYTGLHANQNRQRNKHKKNCWTLNSHLDLGFMVKRGIKKCLIVKYNRIGKARFLLLRLNVKANPTNIQ